MIIYNSMIVWIVLISVLSMLQGNVKYIYEDGSIRIPYRFAIYTFSYIIFWTGIRSGVADTATYISMYGYLEKSFSGIIKAFENPKAPGFQAFSILIKMIAGDNYHIWLMAIAAISGLAVMRTLWAHSENFFFSAFLFVVTTNFTWMLNGIRQFICASLLLLASDCIKERKLFRFLLAVVLLSTVHYSAIVVLPAYWICNGKAFNRKTLFLIVMIVTATFFSQSSISFLERMLEGTAYAGATQQFWEDDGVNVLRVAVMLVPPLIAIFSKRHVEMEDDSYINICINMSIMCAGYYLFGVVTSGILVGRIPIYFELYNLILFPWLFNHCFSEKNKRFLYFLCAASYLLYYYLQMRGSYYISDLTGLLQ